jgi:hypothetical protein
LGSALPPSAAPRQPSATVAQGVTATGPVSGTVMDTTPSFSIDVLSRGTHKIEEGSSFPLLDPQLGELAQGDLTALVSFEGQRLARGPMQLEWALDGVVMDRKAVVLKPGPGAQQVMVRYGNEPSAGTYRITLKLKDHPVRTFTFRITQ